MGLATEPFATALSAGAAVVEDPTVRRHLDALVLFIRTYGEPGINASLAYAWAEGYQIGTEAFRGSVQIKDAIRTAIETVSS